MTSFWPFSVLFRSWLLTTQWQHKDVHTRRQGHWEPLWKLCRLQEAQGLILTITGDHSMNDHPLKVKTIKCAQGRCDFYQVTWLKTRPVLSGIPGSIRFLFVILPSLNFSIRHPGHQPIGVVGFVSQTPDINFRKQFLALSSLCRLGYWEALRVDSLFRTQN